MNWKTTLLAIGLAAAVVIAYSTPPVAAQGAPAAGAQVGAPVKISPAVLAKAKNPTPPANAQTKTLEPQSFFCGRQEGARPRPVAGGLLLPRG